MMMYVSSTAKTHMKHSRKYAQDLQPFQTKQLQQRYGRRRTLSACRPGNFTERFTVHRNAVNDIIVVSF